MTFKNHKDFRLKTLREIRWWAAAAAVLPIAGLATIFYIWVYGASSMINVAMIAGSSIVFAITVTWWWWVLHTISTLIDHWDETKDDVSTVVVEIKEIKQLVRELIPEQKDK